MFQYYYTIFIDKFYDKIVKQIQTLVSDEIIPSVWRGGGLDHYRLLYVIKSDEEDKSM